MPQPPTRPPKNGPGGPNPVPPKAGAGGSKAGVRSDVERALALRDVMDHAVKVQKETTGAKWRPEGRARGMLVGLVCVPLLAFSAYSWIARPEFIWGARVAAPPPDQQEAGIRFAMFLLSRRIEGYRRVHGVYPQSLSAVGDSLEGVTYNRVGDAAFELRATVIGKQIVFRSNEPVDAFLGNSTNIIQGIGPR